MKQRTVNGIPIREVWEKLQAEFPSSAVKRHPSTNKEYVPVEKIEERLNAVVGMENWSFMTDRPQICAFGNSGHESCIVSGRLILYDDDRVPIIRSTGGASDIIYPKDSDRPTSVANAVDSAVQDVFKRCAKRFGIARKEKEANRQDTGSREEVQGQVMKVKVLEPFKALPRGGAKVTVSRGNQTFELVFWSAQWKKLQEKYGEKFRIGAKINEICFFGVEKEYRGVPQLEFISLPNEEGRGAA